MTEHHIVSPTAFRQSSPHSQPWCIERASQMSDIRKACRIVLLITKEMAVVAGERISIRAERRRSVSHYRQIAMYVCHVSLQLSLSEIGQAFGRDRTTVAYSCRVIEDRRDDRAFDEFIAAVERLAYNVVTAAEVRHDG
ncbi:helix-turn-helix domain-containing protein [Martelella limonii]|uniref:helix-turn-helix domain-containing protein n=1 Tax=Martelella limonii TaxID=1647649 RepID=UPI001FCE4BA6|nr:helix-turn-helix domain-containing protein [Martelella limonii]